MEQEENVDEGIDTSTSWVKFSNVLPAVFVGREAVCFGKGSHLVFIDLSTYNATYYLACGDERGDGVECYAGHRILPILAFAEKMLTPRITLLMYPEMNKLGVLEKEVIEVDDRLNISPYGYLSLAFNASDYLMTLAGEPNYELEVWNWRTQEIMASIETADETEPVEESIQVAACSQGTPMNIAKLCIGTELLVVWEFHVCFKKSSFIKYQVRLADGVESTSFIFMRWSPEGGLFVLDKTGNVYLMNADHCLDQIIVAPICDAKVPPSMCWFKGGIALANQNGHLYHWKKISGKWTAEQELETSREVCMLRGNERDLISAWSSKGQVMLYNNPPKNTWTLLNRYVSNVTQVCVLQPDGEYVVTLELPRKLVVWETATGNHVIDVDIDCDISAVVANPCLPLLVVARTDGLVDVMDAHGPRHMNVSLQLKLSKSVLDLLMFHEAGHLLVAADRIHGEVFLLGGLSRRQPQVLAYIDYRRPLLNVCVEDADHVYRLYMLLAHEREITVYSRHVVVKTVSKTSGRIRKKKYTTDYPVTAITMIGDKLYAKPHKKRSVQIVEFTRKRVVVRADVSSGHLMRAVRLQPDCGRVVTIGYDGLVCVHSADLMNLHLVLLEHHRSDKGVRLARLALGARRVFSLGYSGVFVCSALSADLPALGAGRVPAVPLVPHGLAFELGVEHPTVKFPGGEDEGLLYVQVRRRNLVRLESMKYAETRRDLMERFNVLRDEVRALLYENINGPELHRVSLQEFYLHDALRRNRERRNAKLCETTRASLRLLISVQDSVSEWIRQQFWEPAYIKRTYILSLHAQFGVENYVKLETDNTSAHGMELERTLAHRKLEEMVRAADKFEPWVPRSESSLRVYMAREPCIMLEDQGARILEVLETDDSEDTEDTTSHLDMAPSTSGAFIEPQPLRYRQEHVYTLGQMGTQTSILQAECSRLRDYFNTRFDELMAVKQREMSLLEDRNSRLRYILSELGQPSDGVLEVQWSQLEKPDAIITVTPDEVGVKPYVSPSEQELLDWQAAEAERLRLLLLADDFRERALIAMMDGVLEVRWEDTLKRDIPKPWCMLSKAPETFNEDDLRAVRDYEERVAFLNSERLRYRNLLEAEYAKLSDTVRDGVRKFNERLRELLLLKIQVESAMGQEALHVLRMQYTAMEQVNSEKQVANLCQQSEEALQSAENAQARAVQLQQLATECRSAADALQTRERQLEKNFRRDLAECSRLVQEQATKLYRKNPRVQVRGSPAPALLLELGRCVVSEERTRTLIPESLEYLRSVDALDQYVGVPNTIDESVYRIICRHRRLRLDNDLRQRANSIEQSEADAAVAAFQRFAASERTRGTSLADQANEERNASRLRQQNKLMQLVLRQGLVEVPSHGHVDDYEGAALESRQDIDHINTLIRRAGQKKLRIMREAMVHRRTILLREWQHRRLKMLIEDLENELYMVNSVKVTIEVREYLKWRRAKRTPGMTTGPGTAQRLTLEQQVMLLRESYKRVVEQWRGETHALDEQIAEFRRRNKNIDSQIAAINVDVCENEQACDDDWKERHEKTVDARAEQIQRRAALVRLIQSRHDEILVLQTELELLRLRTYPTLKFKTLP